MTAKRRPLSKDDSDADLIGNVVGVGIIAAALVGLSFAAVDPKIFPAVLMLGGIIMTPYAIWFLVRRLNRREDVQHFKLPPDDK